MVDDDDDDDEEEEEAVAFSSLEGILAVASHPARYFVLAQAVQEMCCLST